MKQIVIEKFQYWSLSFHNLLPNLMERAEGIKITYMCDNAREGVKIQIKKKGKTWEPVLQRAHIFRARPTHLGPTPRNETRKGIPTGSLVHAGKVMRISENSSKCRRYLQ